MKRNLIIGLLGFACLIMLLLLFQPQREIQYFEETRLLMDTAVRIVVYDEGFPQDSLKKAISTAFDKIASIENLCSSVIDSSEISRINRYAGISPVQISESVRSVIDFALHTSRLSEGAFDISVLPMSRIWNFYDSSQPFQKPAPEKLALHLKYVDYNKIKLAGNSVFLQEPGMEIDVGGIAKGYAIDQAFEILKRSGLQDFQIDAGGDLRFLAGPVSFGKRKIWIKHPRDRSKLWGYFKLDTGCVATSGDYERFFIDPKDSTRYHHILDPHTGYPAKKSMSVTIIAPDAMAADAFATAIFVMGPENGLKLVESQPGIEAVILYPEKGTMKHVASRGIQDKLVIDQQEISAVN